MSIGSQGLIEISNEVMRNTVEYHVSLEQLRYEAWLKLPPKERSKHPFNPMQDRDAVCKTYKDLLDEAVEGIREHVKRDAQDQT